MINKQKIVFSGSLSKANFELLSLNNDLYLKKKILNPKKRDYESIKKNNFFKKNIKLKNLKFCKIDINSYQELKKKNTLN